MELNEMAKQLGKQGGEATKKAKGTDFYKEISKKGVEARKKKKLSPG